MKKTTVRTIDVRNDYQHSDPTFAAIVKKEPPIFTLAWRNPADYNKDGTRKVKPSATK